MRRYYLTNPSHLIIRSRSSVHPVEWRATELTGYLDSEGTGSEIRGDVYGILEVDVRDLKSGNRAYDMQLPRAVHARRFPSVTAELTSLSGEETGHVGSGSVTFHGETIPASTPLSIEVGPQQIKVAGTTSLDLRSFGFTPPKALGLRVYPEVEVQFAITGRPSETS